MASETSADSQNSTPVTIAVTDNGNTTSSKCRFHTPTMLAAVSKAADGCGVKITVEEAGVSEPRVLFDGTKAAAVEALQKSIVPADKIGQELQKFAQFLLDHSSLKAVGVHSIFTSDGGDDSGFGFITTAPDCTTQQAVALVNCGDANIDEFVTKAKLDVDGRGMPGHIIKPTQAQVEKLG